MNGLHLHITYDLQDGKVPPGGASLDELVAKPPKAPLDVDQLEEAREEVQDMRELTDKLKGSLTKAKRSVVKKDEADLSQDIFAQAHACMPMLLPLPPLGRV